MNFFFMNFSFKALPSKRACEPSQQAFLAQGLASSPWLLSVLLSGLLGGLFGLSLVGLSAAQTPAPAPTPSFNPAPNKAPNPAPNSAATPATPTPLSDLQNLGQKIFTDKNLSEPAGTACANCHDANKGFASLNGSRIGVALGSLPHSFGLRNPMQNAYSAFVPGFTFRVKDGDTDPMGGLFWDGRAANLQQQALAPFLSPVEMNNVSGAQVVAKVAKSPYANQFKAIYGSTIFNNPTLAYEKIGEAIAAFEGSSFLNAFNSKYDRFVQGNAQLSPNEKNGMSLFMSPVKGNCASCHLMNPSSKVPSDNLFTDFAFYATGIPRNTAIPSNANPSFFDLGLCGPQRSKPALTSNVPSNVSIEKFCGTFRMPSLRNVANREVFMHNGFFKNLKEVVNFYATRNTNPKRWYGPAGVPNDLPAAYLSNIVSDRVPFNLKPNGPPALTDAEVNDVVAFLNTLSDDVSARPNPSTPAPNPPGFAGFNPFNPNPAPAPAPAPSPAIQAAPPQARPAANPSPAPLR